MNSHPQPFQRPAARLRVAVADDDPLARTAIEAMLRADGSIELVGVANGVDAIVALTEREQPAVVVLDWMMPHGGGPTAAQKLAACAPHARVVGLSSSDEPQAQLEMLRSGADCFLVKGGTSSDLIRAIHQAAAAAPDRPQS